jgi:fructoselysine-6-P-deglycase FrlB-like protein
VGKPYAEETSRLHETYAWALGAPLDALSVAVRDASTYPLIAIGSGGSYTSAQFAAAVHRQYTSGAASAMTPLEAVSTPQTLRDSAVMLLTAGGKNPDVIGAYRRLIGREPRRLLILCATTGSPLAGIARENPHVDFIDFQTPSGKDGFLATNSLIATTVLLLRAYAHATSAEHRLPPSLDELVGELSRSPQGARPIHVARSFWGRQSIIVLHGPATHAAAVDMESKFSEAALGAVQLADFRNFAHGRHHWLAKRGDESSVVALVTEEDRELADSLLVLLPKRVPRLEIHVPGQGVHACLAALVRVQTLAGQAGEVQGIDPGDPGVPAFGRKIYHLRAFGTPDGSRHGLPAREAAAIERKSGATVSTLMALGRLEEWREAYARFVERLSAASFVGVIFDYDGTLCDERHRFEPLREDVVAEIQRLLRAGAVVGVATGRGKSVREALRAAIDRRHWPRVVVGYYNGGDIAPLHDDERPDGSEWVSEPLALVAESFRSDPTLAAIATLTFRKPQITIEPGPKGPRVEQLWEVAGRLLCQIDAGCVTALRSGHSIDVVAPGVCKRSVVERVGQVAGPGRDGPILCIGDRGRWPGNDSMLLTGPHSLSSDEVSRDRGSCWNLADPGARGLNATLGYLARLKSSRFGLRFKLR